MPRDDPQSAGFAARVREARVAAGITQKALSHCVGVSRPAIVQWETGDTRHVKPENLIKASRALDVRLEWLVLGESPMRPEGPPRPAIDEVALTTILRGVETVLSEERLTLEGSKKAALVAALYATFVESGEIPDDSTVARMTRLAA